jgi:hypothetical protein
MPPVVIDYAPRPLQRRVHDRTQRFGALVCHRRFGKTVLGVNDLIRGALLCSRERPRFAYIAPTFRQGKSVAFDYLVHYSRPIPDVAVNVSELRVDYPNGGQVRIYGGDSPDSLRGLYLDGVVVDEYGLHQSDLFTTVLRPALADREGWCLFLGTPNGKNQFWDIIEHARTTPEWYYGCYKASETGIIPETELAAARAVMTADEYNQEFECSFSASVKGAIYAKELDQARADHRMTTVPYDAALPVSTYWDLGMGDSTAIWFVQSLRGGEVRVIDYYENSGEGLPHYASVLQSKPYIYGTHTAPHDIEVRELGSGKSRLETARALGINFRIAPKLSIEDGIHAARLLLSRCWFDQTKCRHGLEALQHYRRDYNSRLQEFKAEPVHDRYSHAADAFRYLAVSVRPPKNDAPAKYVPSSVSVGSWMS